MMKMSSVSLFAKRYSNQFDFEFQMKYFIFSDAQEEYQIKNLCLLALLELLLSCKMYPNIGDRLNGMFHHIPRLQRLTADSIRYCSMFFFFNRIHYHNFCRLKSNSTNIITKL